MVEYDEQNGTDDADIYKKGKVVVQYDAEDIVFWFNDLESAMQWQGIKAQWTKRQVLVQNLPVEVKAEVKGMLIKNQTEAGELSYRALKREMIRLFDPKEDDAYIQASNLLLTQKPSQLAK